MALSEKESFLIAKRHVDDRALNRRVWNRLEGELDAMDPPVRVVEIGAGVGSMILRFAEWLDQSGPVQYRAIDLDPTVVETARRILPEWLAESGYRVSIEGDRIDARRRSDQSSGIDQLTIRLESGDGFDLDDTADLVVGAALMDIVEPHQALTAMRDLLRDGGVLYLPLTFDGVTGFIPPVDGDRHIARLYHRHMDEIRSTPGGSHAGRELLHDIPANDLEILTAGGSDWVIHPRESGYERGEHAVLDHLLDTIDNALSDYPPETRSPATVAEWMGARRNHLEDGALGLVVHHIDVLAVR